MPRWPNTNAEISAPADAAEYTKPSARADACRSFLITKGRSTLRVDEAMFISAPATNVAQSQVRTRT